MNRCYLCDEILTTENISWEHIIPNAIGGRYKSDKLICGKCNNSYGSKCDALLVEQFQFIVSMLGLKLQRGKPRPIFMKSDDGKEFIIKGNEGPKLAKPEIKTEKINEKEDRIQITARSLEEAKEIISNLQRKYPTINIADTIEKAELKKDPSPLLKTTLTFGGKDVFPAVLKMAVSYYLENTEDVESILDAISDIKKGITDKVEIAVFENEIVKPKEDEVSHFIYVVGDKHQNKLYAIVELFNLQTFIIKLSNKYNRENFESLYVYDVLQKQELTKTINWKPDINYIFEFDYSNSNLDYRLAENRFSRIMNIIQNKRSDEFQQAILNKCMNRIKELFVQGIYPTENIINSVLESILIEHDV